MDLVFIEGSITTTEQEEKLKELRKRSKILVALGTCATFGGVQAMYTGKPNFSKRFRSVYNKNFKIVEAFESKPLEAFVPVDYFIPGCPISPQLFLFNFPRLLKNLPVELPAYPVCVECKWQENECLLLKDIPCLGPATRGGCLARCPKDNLPCVGCFGPVPGGNFASWEKHLLEKKYHEPQLDKKMRFFFGAKIKEVKRGK